MSNIGEFALLKKKFKVEFFLARGLVLCDMRGRRHRTPLILVLLMAWCRGVRPFFMPLRVHVGRSAPGFQGRTAMGGGQHLTLGGQVEWRGAGARLLIPIVAYRIDIHSASRQARRISTTAPGQARVQYKVRANFLRSWCVDSPVVDTHTASVRAYIIRGRCELCRTRYTALRPGVRELASLVSWDEKISVLTPNFMNLS